MTKTAWIIALVVVIILGIGLWWWFRATPAAAPTGGLSAPGAAAVDDTISEINQDLNGIGVDEINLQDIDADINQL
jgi:cytoskeletal protein RodZ